jgi:hypothetical protein
MVLAHSQLCVFDIIANSGNGISETYKQPKKASAKNIRALQKHDPLVIIKGVCNDIIISAQKYWSGEQSLSPLEFLN